MTAHHKRDHRHDGAEDRHSDAGEAEPLGLVAGGHGHQSQYERDGEQNPTEPHDAGNARQNRAENGHGQGGDAEGIRFLRATRTRTAETRADRTRATEAWPGGSAELRAGGLGWDSVSRSVAGLWGHAVLQWPVLLRRRGAVRGAFGVLIAWAWALPGGVVRTRHAHKDHMTSLRMGRIGGLRMWFCRIRGRSLS